VKDTIIKFKQKIMEGEWIKVPTIRVSIETPEVLRRTDLTSLCQNGLALIEMNSFTYGGVSDNFYLMVSTLKYKQDSTSVDLKKSLAYRH
jgi:hypothetical protein